MLLVLFLGLAVVVAGGFIEVRTASVFAVDRSLRGTFGLVLPLASFAVVIEATARRRLADSTWSAARFGVARRDVALGIGLVAALAAALLAALFAMFAVASAFSMGAASPLSDAFVSARIGAFTGAAYAGWFLFGATFFDRGRGAWIVLILDFLLGGTNSVFGVLFPRGNAKNLLGDTAPLGIFQSSSSTVLVVSALVLWMLAALRCRD
jgi:hypothetical protein